MSQTSSIIECTLSDIQIVSKQMLQQPDEGIGDKFIGFAIKQEMRVKAETNTLVHFVDIKLVDKTQVFEFANFRIAVLYEIKNFSDRIKLNDEGLYFIPADIEMFIRPISVSTSRGIIYSELRGTYLHNVIMPIIYFTPIDDIVKSEKQVSTQ